METILEPTSSLSSSSPSYFKISLTSSSMLSIIGLFLLLIQISAPITLFGLIIFLIGLIQVIVDLGWISMTKINLNLDSWRDAYPIVARKRNMKIFLVPVLFDITFVVLALGLFTFYGLKL